MLYVRMMNVLYMMTAFMIFCQTVAKGLKDESDEYCQSEYFRPQCLKHEVILMKSATYGRMRIGKCISEKEIAALGPHFGEDPRYLGCSADVMTLFDHECSGKPQCEIRIFDISEKNIQPCFPGLIVYLQATYTCISVVDEKRSCIVMASKNPTHIIDATTSVSQRICGTKVQPWIVEVADGQRIKVILIDFSSSDQAGHPMSKGCFSYGFIVDKQGKRNVSICGRGAKREEEELHLSTGSRIEIFLSGYDQKKSNGSKFVIRIEAVGCSDIIPPEDTWLKRNGDKIQIGCYSSRQTWQLSCNAGKWIGVLGNCSRDNSIGAGEMVKESNSKVSISNDEQVLAIVAICGCTLAICLAIVCIGAVCLRRFYADAKKKQEYKTLNHPIHATMSQQTGQQRIFSQIKGFRGDEVNGYEADDLHAMEHAPTYSVFDEDNSVGSTNQRALN